MKLVMVEWIDSETESTPWVYQKDLEELEIQRSYGILIQETKKSITLAMTPSSKPDGQIGNVLTIPQVAIFEVWEITLGE